MKLPVSWLKEFVDVPVEPARLGEALTFVGFALEGIEKDGRDTVLDIEVTTNRVDGMNVYGLAREVSVIYGVPLRPLDTAFRESGPPASQSLDLEIEARDLCPRFCARVLDVRLGPSPSRIRDRLEQMGVRPINNVVDLTNYVMMEMGHPSHAFDLAKIPEGRLRVRWAREGERLRTLDGVDRTFDARVGVVAGPQEALALAGIMGGASSEVSEETRAVALEAAYWEPLAIRRAAKALGMHTEASHRFERGADPEGPPLATARLAHLLLKTGGGSVRPGLIDRVTALPPRRSVALRPSKQRILLGVEVAEARSHEILAGLGFVPGRKDGEATLVDVPSWRGDVSREVDLIEEVGRHHGLDKIAATQPPALDGVGLRPAQARERAVRECLVAAGLNEVITYAFVSGARSAPLLGARVELQNPLAEDHAVLRGSVVVPGLLGSLEINVRQGRRDVRIFELGQVYHPAPERPREERRLGVLLTGAAAPGHWSGKPRPVDFFDLMGTLDALCARLGLAAFGRRPEGAPAFLHPGRSVSVLFGEESLGYAGALHPELMAAWDLRDETLVAELRLAPILEVAAPAVRFQPLPRFPAVGRDLSVVCGAGLPATAIAEQVRSAAGPLLVGLSVADRYEGPQVAEGRISLTLSLRYQHRERTLTGEEVEASVDSVIRALRAGGAEIRGE